MDSISEIRKRYDIGQEIFEQFFELSDQELKDKLKTMPGVGPNAGGITGLDKSLFDNSVHVTRVIRNEKPEKITIEFYDSIEINWSGIRFKPEHGSSKDVIIFSENFKF